MIDGMIDFYTSNIRRCAVDQPSEKRSVRITDKYMWAAWGLKDMVTSRLGGFLVTKIVIVQPMGVIGQLLDLNIGSLNCSHEVPQTSQADDLRIRN